MSDGYVLGADENKKSYNVESGQAKFTKANDDVNVNAQTKLIGLTKEQLEQYRNDPFWKPIRYALLVLFWLVWFAMFVGAILIVVLSPKCNADVKTQTKWYENLVNYQIYTPTFNDADGDGVGDLKGIEQKLEELRKIGVQSIWPTPLVKANKDEFSPPEVLDILSIDERFGTMEDLKSLIAAAHAKNINFIADLPLTVSHDNQWATSVPGAMVELENKASNSSLLNVDNEQVRSKLLEAATKFLRLGADGIHFADYGFGKKTTPKSLDPLIQKISNAVASDNQIKQKDVLIFVESTWTSSTLANYRVFPLINIDDKSVIDHLSSNVLTGSKVIQQNATAVPKPIWKYTDIDSPRLDQRLELDPTMSEHSAESAAILTMVQLFLPGPVNVYYGEEIGLPSIKPVSRHQYPQRGLMRWNAKNPNDGFSSVAGQTFFGNLISNTPHADFSKQYQDTSSLLSTFKRLTYLRNKNQVFKVGILSFVRDGLYLYSRYIADSPNAEMYVLAINWPVDGKGVTRKLHLKPDFVQRKPLSKVEVKATSPNAVKHSSRVVNLESEDITLEPYQAVLIYIP